MKWRRIGPYAGRSTCGRWQISHSRHGETPKTDLYSLWRRDPDTGACIYVHAYPTLGQAKQRARDEEARR